MEQEQDSTGVSRGQNQLHVLPEDWQAAAAAIEPLLDRLAPETAAPQLLVLTSDAEAAAGIAGHLAPAAIQRGLRILGATDARRAERVHRASPAHVVIAPVNTVVELMRSAVLKSDAVRAVVLAWVDDMSGAATRSLETLMAELPKDAARVIVASSLTTTVEQLVERYARRPRRMQAVGAAPVAPVSLSFVVTSETGRLDTLRRTLDALDPESAFVVARGPQARRAVESLLQSLGYPLDSTTMRTGDAPDEQARLVLLFEMPTSEDELRALASRAGTRVIALVTARQVGSLRRIAGGAVSPLSLPEAAVRARSREEALRDELRRTLTAGQFSRELLALEPLLSEYDGAEIAAAALRLLESDRAKPQPVPGAAAGTAFTRLYVNIGSTDNVRPGDLVGAITNEAGISKDDLGKVDVRERHSTVEVATPLANTVVSKLTGVTIRGRRVIARVDEGPERRDRPPRPRHDDRRAPSRERRPKR